MARKLRILVLGSGSIGLRHARNVVELASERPLSLAVADSGAEAREAARATGVKTVYEGLEVALESATFDAALICTPNQLHVAQARQALSQGCHLFVEKPLASSWAEAEDLRREVEKSGRFLMVGCNLRFHPGVTTLKAALANGAIGRPLYARAHFAHYLPNWRPHQDYRTSYSARRNQGGGILLDSIHEPDYLCWLLGMPEAASGTLARIGDLEIDVEDVANYSFRHAGGCRSHIHVDYLRRDKVRGCEICGTDGTLVWSSTGKSPESVTVRLFTAGTGMWRTLFEDPAYDMNTQYIDEILYFLDCIENGIEPMNGPSDAIRLLKALDAVRHSDAISVQVPVN